MNYQNKIEMNVSQLFICIHRQKQMTSNQKSNKKCAFVMGVHRCGNCDAVCGDQIKADSYMMVAGRQEVKKTRYFCDRACAYKSGRDALIIDFTNDMDVLSKSLKFLSQIMGGIISAGRTSKSCFEAIKMTRLQIKCKKMLLAREIPRPIVEVELFKLSECAMRFAELVAEEEDMVFNIIIKGAGEGDYSQMEAYNLAMWARELTEDKDDCLSMWFD